MRKTLFIVGLVLVLFQFGSYLFEEAATTVKQSILPTFFWEEEEAANSASSEVQNMLIPLTTEVAGRASHYFTITDTPTELYDEDGSFKWRMDYNIHVRLIANKNFKPLVKDPYELHPELPFNLGLDILNSDGFPVGGIGTFSLNSSDRDKVLALLYGELSEIDVSFHRSKNFPRRQREELNRKLMEESDMTSFKVYSI